MTPKQLLENWGRWCRSDTGRPQGCPTTSPMFANHGTFTDSAWGDPEAAPEPARLPIFEGEAQRADAIIRELEPVDQAILKNEFYRRNSTISKIPAEQYSLALAEAVAEFAKRYDAPVLGKQRVLQMLEAGCWPVSHIAIAAKVSRQYVWQVKSGKA